MSAWRAKITLCSGLCCSTCLVRWLNENKTSLCLALTPSGNHQWKKKAQNGKYKKLLSGLNLVACVRIQSRGAATVVVKCDDV